MAAVEIFSQKQTGKLSDPFRVDKGHVVVLSAFNLSCPQTDDVGTVTRKGDCFILHKLEVSGKMEQRNDACGCVFKGGSSEIVSSEPVVVCGSMWTLTNNTNLAVLSVPGYYMLELCNEGSVGSAVVKVEELTVADAALLPETLYLGS